MRKLPPLIKNCEGCKADFELPRKWPKETKYCSFECYLKYRVVWNKGKSSPNKGKKRRPEIGQNISKSKKGKKRSPFSEEWRKNIGRGMSGEKNYQWITDRSKITLSQQQRRSLDYKQWRKDVFIRDKYKCQTPDANCTTYLEAHHILPWRSHPDSRFAVNNGITLCKHHHPRSRLQELLLVPTYQEINKKHEQLIIFN
jgi:HNH endonuclease